MKLQITVLALITSCALITHAMDYFSSIPNEIMPRIFKEVVLTLEESETFRKTEFILQIPEKLQALTPLRLVHALWRNHLTTPQMLSYSDVSTEELVRWQCYRAVEKNKETGNDSEASFYAMGYLILSNIVNPNMLITIRSSEYLNPKKDECIGINKLPPLVTRNQVPIGTPVEFIRMPLLHYALRCNTHPLFIELLIRVGANITFDMQHHQIRTPLYVAVVYNSSERSEIIFSKQVLSLLSMGASFDQKNKAGDTLLHSIGKNKAIESGRKITLFVESMLWGADLTLTNGEGNTAESQCPIPIQYPNEMRIRRTQHLELLEKMKEYMKT